MRYRLGIIFFLRHVVFDKAVAVHVYSVDVTTTLHWNTPLTPLHVSTVLCHHQRWLAQVTICSAPVFKLFYGNRF